MSFVRKSGEALARSVRPGWVAAVGVVSCCALLMTGIVVGGTPATGPGTPQPVVPRRPVPSLAGVPPEDDPTPTAMRIAAAVPDRARVGPGGQAAAPDGRAAAGWDGTVPAARGREEVCQNRRS